MAWKADADRRIAPNIKVNLKEHMCEVMDWIHLAQDKVHW